MGGGVEYCLWKELKWELVRWDSANLGFSRCWRDEAVRWESVNWGFSRCWRDEAVRWESANWGFSRCWRDGAEAEMMNTGIHEEIERVQQHESMYIFSA